MQGSLRLAALALVVATQAPPSGIRLVQVSVVVHDGRHQPVEGLTARDFQLLEDGTEVPVSLVDLHAEAGDTVGDTNGIFTNHVRRPARGGVVALVFDRLNTTLDYQSLARDEIVKRLALLDPDDRVALYLLGPDGIQVLHDFTADARPLIAALRRATARPSSAAQEGTPEPVGVRETLDAQIEAFVNGGLRTAPALYQRTRTYSGIKGLEEVAEHLAGVPGRKNLVWLSSSLPFTLDEAATVLNDSDIAVYSVTVRGVDSAVENPAGGLAPIAEWTGGRAYETTNDLGDAIRAAVDDSRMSYVLSYQPAPGAADGTFRPIAVSVRRPGVTVRHRTGHFSTSSGRSTAAMATQEIVEALDSPLECTEMPLVVGARLDESGHHVLTLQIDGGGLTLKRYGDRWSGSFDVTVAQTLATGEHVREADVTVPLSFPDAMRDEFLEDGMAVTRTITLRPDAHQVRVITRDVASSAVGSVIIPAADLRKP